MPPFSRLIAPRFSPPLEPDFRPAALVMRAFAADTAGAGVPLIIAVERSDNEVSRYETTVFPADHPRAQDDLYFVERIVKFLLWQRGGHTVYIGGPRFIGEYIRKAYAPDGERKFDYHFMGDQVYERAFKVIPCDPAEVPPPARSARNWAATWTAAASASTWALLTARSARWWMVSPSSAKRSSGSRASTPTRPTITTRS